MFHRGLAFDQHRPRQGPRIDLVLHTSAASEKSRRALRTIHRALDTFDAQHVNLTVCDLADRPSQAEEDPVVFTPLIDLLDERRRSTGTEGTSECQ